MANEFIIFLGIFFFFSLCIIIYKKPEVIKKNTKEPLSIKNFGFKKVLIGDWKSFAIWVLVMFLVWGYAHDTQQCREFLENVDNYCIIRVGEIQNNCIPNGNISELNIVGDTNRESISWSDNKSRSSIIISSDS